LENFEKKFPVIQGERKKIMQHTIGKKKYHAKESAQKKIQIPTCKSTDVLHFSIVSTGLQYFDLIQYCVHRLAIFSFLSRHICFIKEHGVKSGQHHRDFTAFGAYNTR
jgi:hypothetical protein